MEKTGERLREFIKMKGLTQAQFAEQAGVNPSIVSWICNGKREATIEQLITFARLLNTSVDHLIGNDGTGIELKTDFRQKESPLSVSIDSSLAQNGDYCIYSEWETKTISKGDLLVCSNAKPSDKSLIVADVSGKTVIGTLFINNGIRMLVFDNGDMPIMLSEKDIVAKIIRVIKFYK